MGSSVSSFFFEDNNNITAGAAPNSSIGQHNYWMADPSDTSNSNSNSTFSISVRYSGREFKVDGLSGSDTLTHLKKQLQDQCNAPASDRQKIIFKGVTLKDGAGGGQSATLTSFGIGPGSKLMLVGSSSSKAVSPTSAPKKSAPAVAPKTIASVSEPLTGLTKELDEFESFLSKVDNKEEESAAAAGWNKKRQDNMLRLQEMLMRIILKLDVLTVPSDETVAAAWKLERKDAIKKVQNQLHRLDKLMADHPERK